MMVISSSPQYFQLIHTGRTVLNIRATWKNVVTGPNFATLKLFNNSNDSNNNNKTNIDDDDNSKIYTA